MIPMSHERRQVFRHRGASGVGEFGPQSGRKRLQELHRVEGDGGQTAHPNAPTDPLAPTVRSLCCESDRGGFVPTRREDFRGRWSWTVRPQCLRQRIAEGDQGSGRCEPSRNTLNARGVPMVPARQTTMNSVLGSVQLWS